MSYPLRLKGSSISVESALALGSQNQTLKEIHELNRAGLTSGHVLSWNGSAFVSAVTVATDLTAYSTTSQANNLYGSLGDVSQLQSDMVETNNKVAAIEGDYLVAASLNPYSTTTQAGNLYGTVGNVAQNASDIVDTNERVAVIEGDYLVAASLSSYITSASVASGYMASTDPAFSGKMVQSGVSVSEEKHLKFIAMTSSSTDVIKDFTLPASGSVLITVKALFKNKGRAEYTAVYHNAGSVVGLISGTDSSEFFGTTVVGSEVVFNVSASNVLSVRAAGNATLGSCEAAFSLKLLSV